LVRQLPIRTQTSRALAEGSRHIQEVFILADEHAIIPAGMLPVGSIGCATQGDVENMLAIDAARSQKAGKSRGELVIDQKLHEACRTV
jgi:hypothetical protein